ncbi:dynein light chain binding protein [Aureococcus anophagefferens]|nr:dynein light chain binding protein [Aureococcus anophagefferens]
MAASASYAGASQTKMSHLDFILHALNGIQRKWVYLEPIFGRGSLPNEAKRFKSVDEDFRDIMRNVEADPKLFGLVDPHVHRDIRRTLETMLDQLDRCQKALSDFLEEKRSAFPRFYFIGDDDLLEILGQAKNPAVIQSHLKKLFQGVSRVVFDDAKTTITAMVSAAARSPSRAARDAHGQDLSGMPVAQLKVKALVMDLVHNMDVLDQLDRARCRDAHDWAWHKQLRYYVGAAGGAEVRMSDGSFRYTYEYQGNAGKLVHTPLTDKCYLTLTQGMHMGFGGNPYGPAGTGKTESVKALGNARPPGIDFQSMGRIFIGLVKRGAWGCFDEFNRLKEDQLSAISQQIQLIQDAIKGHIPVLRLLGRDVDVDFDAGIFVTLNPAGNYGGRSQIPDNLKALFRPVAMGRPDNELIAQLTPQRHYDWGLRALKAVLNTGGKLVLDARGAGGGLPPAAEGELLIKAVRVNTPSKLTFGDTARFLALIGDVFPGVASGDVAGGALEVAIRDVMASDAFRLTVDEAQVLQAALAKCGTTDADLRPRLEGWLDDLFYRALDYVVALGALVADDAAGTVLNGLGGAGGATSKLAFVAGLVRGLGGNLGVGDRTAFAKEVFAWAGERPPDLGALDCDCEPGGDRLFPYAARCGGVAGGDGEAPTLESVIETVSTQRTMAMLRPMVEGGAPSPSPARGLRQEPHDPPRAARRKVGVATLHCSARTDASHVIAKIGQCCSLFSAPEGVYRPRLRRLVLYLKDLNLPRPDAYDTCMLIAFLQQLLTAVYAELLEIALDAAGARGGDAAAANLAPFSKPGEREKLAATLVEVYERVKATFVVDDARHYLFTPRDLSAWVSNLLRYDLASEDLLNVVAYEGLRLFKDRMVDADAEAKLDGILGGVLRSRWRFVPALDGVHFTTLAAGAIGAKGGGGGGAAPLLRRVETAEFRAVVGKGVDYYERENAELRMLLFDRVLDHVARVDRVISRPGGNLLLIGRSGVGRRTAVRLVAYMRGYAFVGPTAVRADDDDAVKHFRSELKPALQTVAVEGQEAVFYVEDHHFAVGACLELVNSVLSAGAAPGRDRPALRARRSAVEPRREGKSARGEGKGGEGKGRGGAAAPAPRGGGGGDAGGDVDDQLLEAIASMHESAAAASPREFVLFLENWRMLHDQMRGGIRTKLSHLSAGLAKLEEASATVDSLSNNAEVEQAKLVEAQKGADAAMEMITKTLSEATGRRGEVNDLKTEVTRREEHTISRQGEIKQELSSIQPVLETAKAAVGQIKAEHLNEIRSLKMPPEPIADVLGAVLKLLGISDVSWTSMKKFLGNRGVKDEILNYDARRIGGEMRKDVARLLKQKSTSFDQATITLARAAPLAAWVKANIRYSVVLEKIQPLEAELARAEEDLAKCTLRLRQCEDEIATIDDRVAALKAEFGDKTREAEKLRARLALAEGTLDKAQHLLGKLSGEQARWQTQAGDLRSELASLPRQLLVAAGFLTYLSRCPEDAREAALADWTATVGLPADPLSMENALVVAHNPGARVPFVIDPADAARAWLVAHYGGDDGRPLEVLQSADARFGTTVELAVRFGKTLLIFDVDARAAPRRRAPPDAAAQRRAGPRDPSPARAPQARARALPARAPRPGHERPASPSATAPSTSTNFRLALVTRNPTPDLPPDAAALCTLVNFTVTRSGLEGQLLGATIQHEEPELETKKTAMLKQEEDYKIKLAGLETDLLEALATAEGDLLENALLIESLTRTKEASREISTPRRRPARPRRSTRAARRTAASRATAAGSTSSSATSSS